MTLEYETPRPADLPDISRQSPAVVFALSHLVCESITDFTLFFGLHVFYPAPTNHWESQRLFVQFVLNMAIEALNVTCAAIVLALGQAICRRFLGAVPRRNRSGVAALLGAGYCGVRWGIYWLSRALPFPFTDRIAYGIDVMLVLLCVPLLVQWGRRRQV